MKIFTCNNQKYDFYWMVDLSILFFYDESFTSSINQLFYILVGVGMNSDCG